MAVSDQDRMLAELESSIDRLQALYNQYFMGIEKLEPTIARKDVERKVNLLRKTRFEQTALRFKFNSLVQRLATHQNRWNRICRQIEEGTYKRDVIRAQRRMEKYDDAVQVQSTKEAMEEDSTAKDDSFDLGEMFADVDDPFSSGLSLGEEMARAAKEAEASVKRVRSASSSSPGGQGVRVPLSSVRASQKTDLHRSRMERGAKGQQVKVPDKLLQPSERASATDSSGVGPGSFFKPRPNAATPPPPKAPKGVKPTAMPPVPGAKSGGSPSPPRAAADPPAARMTDRPAPPPRKRVAAPPDGALNSAPKGVDERRIQAVYKTYVAARQKTNESVDNLSYEKVAGALKKTAATKGAKDFKVVIKNGKAVIKTVK